MRQDAAVLGITTALASVLASCNAERVELSQRPSAPPAIAGTSGISATDAGGPLVLDGPLANSGGTSAAAGALSTAPVPAPMTEVVPTLGTLPAFNRDDTSQSGLSSQNIQLLKSGSAPCSVGIAYPSEGTLFPGGLTPPTIMWPLQAGQTQAGAHVHMAYEGDTNTVDYQFAVDGSKPGQMSIPRDAWQAITARTNGKNLNVELKIDIAGKVQACTSHWRVAHGNLTGSLFYYQTPTNQADALGMLFSGMEGGAGIFRLRLGAAEHEPFIVNPAGLNCVGCHSMNARGTRIVAPAGMADFLSLDFAVSYDVYDVSSNKPTKIGVVDNAAFGGMTPDGKYILSAGAPDCTAGELADLPPNGNQTYVEGPAVAKLVDAETGKEVVSRGLEPDYYMWMPQFSPDGTKVVFNHAKPDPKRPGFTDRRELAVMDYDRATQTFSNLRVIVSHLGPDPSRDYMLSSIQGFAHWPASGRGGCTSTPASTRMYPMGVCEKPCYPAWPAFTPDGQGVVFSLLDQPDFNHTFGRTIPAQAHLYYSDLRSAQVVRLENAMRVNDPAEFGFDNYTTVLPVSAGGYAWLFWTGRRSWGTQGKGLFAADATSGVPNPAGDPNARKIWGSAIRLAGNDELKSTPLTDPSSPAFYLEGQGSKPSMRAFAALNPCSADGTACGSGVDCCAGFCTAGVCGAPAAMSCSKIMDACKQSADCCQSGAGQACIGGFCDVIVLQ